MYCMNNWLRVLEDTMPPESTRVLISDGEVITIAHYIYSENHINWFFENNSFKDMKITWWIELPVLPLRVEVLNSVGK